MFNKSIFKVSSLLVITFLSSLVFAQQSHDEILQKFLEQRKRMMEEIMKSFDGEDDFLKDDFFGDEFFEEFKKHGFSKLKGLEHRGRLVSVEEKVHQDGSIDIFIKPSDKNIKLDIQTTDDQIVIKGETMVSQEDKSESNHTRSMFKSSFSRIVAIPTGYLALPAQPIKDGLKIKLVQKDKNYFKKTPNKNEKKPVGKLPGERTI